MMSSIQESGIATRASGSRLEGRIRVCFLCTRNSARSLIAEALLRHLAGDRFEVLSAGMNPGEVHPFTRRVLEEAGIDPSPLHSKGIETVMGRVGITYAIVVCGANEAPCPRVYPFAVHTLFWPFQDPSAEPDERAQLAKFREVRDEIGSRIRSWLSGGADSAEPMPPV